MCTQLASLTAPAIEIIEIEISEVQLFFSTLVVKCSPAERVHTYASLV